MEKLYLMQQVEIEIKKLMEQKANLANDTSLSRLKTEFQKLKAGFEHQEGLLNSNKVQTEAKNNEMNNLMNDQIVLEENMHGNNIELSKKLDNTERQMEKLQEKMEMAESSILKLNSEGKNIEGDINEIKKKMVFIKKKYMNAKEVHVAKEAEFNETLARLNKELDAFGQCSEEELVEQYNKLKRRYTDPIALVNNRSCAGCNVEMSTMDYEAVRANKEIIRCESCGRILFKKN